MSFSVMLRKLREEKHLSQKDIAEYLGITRQAVAAYELAKREPDYNTLRKLADFFSVSVDYLLGRAGCKEFNAVTIGMNIELIRGNMTYKELSEDIGRKTGILIFPEMLQSYARGEKIPFMGTIKLLARYADVSEEFFYNHNTPESYAKEQEFRKKENILEDCDVKTEDITTAIHIDNVLVGWITDKENLPYIKLAKEIQESGMSVEMLKPLIRSIKGSKDFFYGSNI